LTKENLGMKMRQIVLMLLAINGLAVLSKVATAQALADRGEMSTPVASAMTPTNPQPDLTYTRPTEKTKLLNYSFNTCGPYPIIGRPRSPLSRMHLNNAHGAPPKGANP
jgi:hypothetical protein